MDQAEHTAELIRAILTTCLIDHPEDLRVSARDVKGSAVFWSIQCHASDYPKVCGTRGAHIKALMFLIAELGYTVDVEYKTWLKEPIVGAKLPSRAVEIVDEYDTGPARELLARLVAAILGTETVFAVNVAADGSRINVPPFSLLFTFEIKVRTVEDHERLTLPFEGDVTEKRTVVDSIDEIFRAYAAKSGVAFAVKVLPP